MNRNIPFFSKGDYKTEYYEANKEELLKRRKEYYLKNKEKYREYYQANREAKLAYQKEWNAANKEKVKVYTRRYWKKYHNGMNYEKIYTQNINGDNNES